ncbi:MAG: class I SAM-dependent methyltransferase [Salinimicrobium sp.]
MPEFNFLKEPVLVCEDHTVSGKRFELRKDEQYDLLATFPRPSLEELPEFYKSEDYISHTDSKKSIFDRIYQAVKSYMLQKKIGWIEKRKSGKGNLLDLGAGTGDFLAEAKKSGWKIFGAEPNSGARDLAAQKGVELLSDTSSFKDHSFDVITMWHVLEHVPDLDTQIKELDRLLKKDGLLVIAVPNFKSADAKAYSESWAAYDVPRHLFHFSRTAIKKIFGERGFSLTSQKGLFFDSFYVSLLSEKIQTGHSNPVKAFWRGLSSNLSARRTGEYSSLVYFLKKS